MANKANLANSVLFAPLSDSDTELEVYTGDNTLFPAAPFYLTLSPKNKWSRKINSEIVLVTAKDDDVFTITRAQKGTTAMEFSYGDLVANGVYTEDLDDTVDEAVAAALQAMMPVGFVITLGVSTNPNTLYGFGTWTQIEGRVIVGVSNSDGDFDLNDTGGAKDVTLTSAQSGVPAHKHPFPDGSIMGVVNTTATTGSGSRYNVSGGQLNTANNTAADAASPHTNLQPYISKYVWQRTA